MRIVSDVHGKVNEFLDIVESTNDNVIQVGDLGFYNAWEMVDNWCKNNEYRIYVNAGNHDNYPNIEKYDFYLGDYGLQSIEGFEFFSIRGAYSVDQEHRKMYDKAFVRNHILTYGHCEQEHFTWFPEEELSEQQLESAIKEYIKIKPNIVISHELPASITNMISNPIILLQFNLPIGWNSRTAKALQSMFELHQPKLWVGGHLHQNFDRVVNGTRFICQKELGYIDVDVNGDII